MTSRERVKKALSHNEIDRVPVDFGATPVTGMAASLVYNLRQYFGLDKQSTPVKVIEPYQMLGEIGADLKQILRLDCVGISPLNNMFGFENKNWKEWKLFDGTPVLVPGLFNTEPTEKGDILMYPGGDKSAPASGRMPKGGFYFDTIVRQPPIDEHKLKIEDNLDEFQPVTDTELEYFRKEVDFLYQNTDSAIVANFGGTAFGDIGLVPAPFLKHPKGIRDVEEWYISTVTRKNHIYKIFERQCEIALQNLKKIKQVVLNKVAVMFVCGTDFGTQQGLLISPEMYRNLYKPFYKEINAWVHKNTKWKTFKHSCGSIEPLIPEFIDSGFDILNPIQCSAANMEPMLLKEKYGSQIVFWGGGVDTKKTLPFGTPEQVKREVEERIDIFSQGGGFVFNAIHNLQAGLPLENVIAMFEAVRKQNNF